MGTIPQRHFFVADLNAAGELRLLAEYRYEDLERIPPAAELIAHFGTLIWRYPDEFETALPSSRGANVRWRATAATAGLATFRCGTELVAFSLYASGRSPSADELTLGAFQLHLLRELRDTGFEPSFDLVHVPRRPLVATVNFRDPADEADQLSLALADRCLAAAYFRSLDLA